MTASLKTVRIEKTFPVSAERLWEAWLDPEILKRWLAPGVMKVTGVSVDPSEGGEYRLQMRDPGGALAEVEASFVALVPQQRIELQWQWKGLSGVALLVVEFVPVSENETLLRLSHGEFGSMDETQNHQNGWQGCLDKLFKVLAA